MTLAYEPAKSGQPRTSATDPPALRLFVGPIAEFSQANGLLKRIRGLPAVRAAELSNVTDGSMLVDLWPSGAGKLSASVRVLWGDYPGTVSTPAEAIDGVPVINVTLGTRSSGH